MNISPLFSCRNLKTEQTMSNSSNNKQIQVLISFMERNRDIANGFTTNRSKEGVIKFWKEVEKELNSLGPPTKSISDWKKVWLDKKKYVRKKLSENVRQKNATGGGPNKEYKFTALEETIIRICALEESAEGCPDALTFGLPSCSRKRKADGNRIQTIDSDYCLNSLSVSRTVEVPEDKSFDENILYEVMIDSTAPEEEIAEKDNSQMNIERTPTPRLTKKPQKGITCGVALEREIEIQKELCNKIEEAVGSMKSHQKEMEYHFKKIYRSIDKISEFQKKTLDETLRHNLEMEKMKCFVTFA